MIRQIKFIDKEAEGQEVFGGILLDDGRVICACCGGVFEPDEVEIIEVYEDWVNFSEEIINEY